MMNSLRLLRSIPLRHQLVSYRNVSRAVVCLQGRNSDAWKTERQPSEFKKVHNNPAGVGSKAYEGQQVKSEVKSEDPEEEMNRKDPSKKDGYMAGQGFEDHQSPVQRGDKGTSYRPSEYDEVAERATKEFEAKNYSEDQLHSAQHLQHGAYRKDPLTNMADKAKDMKDKVKEKMHDAKDNIADKMHDAGDKMADKAYEANDKASHMNDNLKDKAEKVKDTAQGFMSDAKGKMADKAHEVGDKASHMNDNLKDKAEEVKDKAQGFVSDSKDKMADAKDKVGEKIADAKEKVSDKVADVKDKASDKMDDWVAASDAAQDTIDDWQTTVKQNQKDFENKMAAEHEAGGADMKEESETISDKAHEAVDKIKEMPHVIKEKVKDFTGMGKNK